MILSILADITFYDVFAWVILNLVLITIGSFVWMKFLPDNQQPMDLSSIKKENE